MTNQQQVTTWLTLVITGLWVISAVARIWVEFPAGYVLDAAMPMIVGFWFVSNSATKKNGASA